jgi:hypothetical protein
VRQIEQLVARSLTPMNPSPGGVLVSLYYITNRENS